MVMVIKVLLEMVRLYSLKVPIIPLIKTHLRLTLKLNKSVSSSVRAKVELPAYGETDQINLTLWHSVWMPFKEIVKIF